MTGWAMEGPQDWSVVPLRGLFRRREERGRSDLPLLSVYRDLGVVPRKGRDDNFNREGDNLAMYKVVRPGDLVVNKMKTWQGSLGIAMHEGIVSPAYFVATRIGNVEPRFIHHLLRSRPLIAEYAARSKGIRPSQWDLPWDELMAIKVRVPPQTEQRAIATYLDAETSRIDAVIVKKRGINQLLDAREVSLAHAVITGIPVEGERRDSGMPWLGTLPASWPMVAVSSQFIVQLGRMLNPERASNGRLRPYVRNENVRWDVVDTSDLAKMDFPTRDGNRYLLQTGDLLVNEGGAGIGRAAIWQGEVNECYFQKSVHRLRPIGWTDPRWLLAWLRVVADRKVFLVEGNLATIPHVPAESLRVFRFPCPPTSVQESLLSWAEEQRRLLTEVRHRIDTQLRLLAERRQALITAAVTGAIEIPGAAA